MMVPKVLAQYGRLRAETQRLVEQGFQYVQGEFEWQVDGPKVLHKLVVYAGQALLSKCGALEVNVFELPQTCVNSATGRAAR